MQNIYGIVVYNNLYEQGKHVEEQVIVRSVVTQGERQRLTPVLGFDGIGYITMNEEQYKAFCVGL